MMTLDQANTELLRAAKAKDAYLLVVGPETIRRGTPKVPDWLPPGVYEFSWNVPREDEWLVTISGKVVIDPPQPKGAESSPDGNFAGMDLGTGQTLPPFIQQMFVLSQQISNIRAGAKDEFYTATLAMMKDNQTILADERRKMREELADERKEFVKAYSRLALTPTVESPEESLVDVIKGLLAMDEVKSVLSAGAQIALAKFAGGGATDVTP